MTFTSLLVFKIVVIKAEITFCKTNISNGFVSVKEYGFLFYVF
jgi:hypothetical protein